MDPIVRLFRNFGAPGRKSSGRKTPLTQQIEFRAAIHLAFQQFQPVDLALGLAIAPFQSECRVDRRFILAQARSEVEQLSQALSHAVQVPGSCSRTRR